MRFGFFVLTLGMGASMGACLMLLAVLRLG